MVFLYNYIKKVYIMMVALLLCLLSIVEIKAMEQIKPAQPVVRVFLRGIGEHAQKSFLLEVPYNPATQLVAINDLYIKALSTPLGAGTIIFCGQRLSGTNSIHAQALREVKCLFYLQDKDQNSQSQ